MSNSPYFYQPDDAAKSKRRSGGSSGGGGGSNKVLKIILIVMGVMVLLCGGVVLVGQLVVMKVLDYSVTAIAKVAVDQSPVAKEVIGEVDSATLNTHESDLRADGSLVIDVHGAKGGAKIILNADKENGKIDLPNGQSIPFKNADIKNAYKKE